MKYSWCPMSYFKCKSCGEFKDHEHPIYCNPCGNNICLDCFYKYRCTYAEFRNYWY